MLERQLSSPESPEFCQLRYHAERHLLVVSWQGYVTAELAQEGAEAVLELLSQRPCCYLLNDNTGMRGPWFGSLLWLARQWGPAAARAGLKCVAHVVRAGTLATTFMATPIHHLFTDFEIQIFDSLAEADDWISDHKC